MEFGDLSEELSEPTDLRIFAIPEALKKGYSIDKIYELTHIDKWFLYKVANIVEIEGQLRQVGEQRCSRELLLEAKQYGFSDNQIARSSGCDSGKWAATAQNYKLSPVWSSSSTRWPRVSAQTIISI
jgi:carbamoyl-phosphate synthase large subunit